MFDLGFDILVWDTNEVGRWEVVWMNCWLIKLLNLLHLFCLVPPLEPFGDGFSFPFRFCVNELVWGTVTGPPCVANCAECNDNISGSSANFSTRWWACRLSSKDDWAGSITCAGGGCITVKFGNGQSELPPITYSLGTYVLISNVDERRSTPEWEVFKAWFGERKIIWGQRIWIYTLISALILVIFFSFSPNNRSRDHPSRLIVPLVKSNVKKHFFSCRVVHPWNHLPSTMVTNPSPIFFKTQLNKINLNKFLIHPSITLIWSS